MEYDLELPQDSLLTQQDLEEIAKVAEDLNLPKDKAEALLKQREETYKKGYGAYEQQLKAHAEAEVAALKADPAFATKEAFDESMVHINRVVSVFGNEDLVKALNTGIGNNLHIAKFLRTLGEAMAPESAPAGKGAATSGPADSRIEALKRMYPSMK
jgi:stalled ribosome alternative rescue factor ArfA